MPQDTKDETAQIGRTYRGEVSPPITTPEAVAAKQELRKTYDKPGAIPLTTYFVVKGIDNAILQASMTAYTDVRTATVEDFDAIFETHHRVPVENPS